MNPRRRYLIHLQRRDGVIMIIHTEKGRCRRLIDLWLRFRFFLGEIPVEFRSQRRPFRLSKALRAAVVRSLTIDKNFGQSNASAAGPTERVGKEDDNIVSPFRGDTST